VNRQALDFIFRDIPEPISPSPAPRHSLEALEDTEEPQSEPMPGVRSDENEKEAVETQTGNKMSLDFLMSG